MSQKSSHAPRDIDLEPAFWIEMERLSETQKQEKIKELGVIIKQWRKITEKIRREILTNIQVRRDMEELASYPVEETLPLTALERIDNEEIQKFVKRYKERLLQYLKIPAIEEHFILPDIRNARKYKYSFSAPLEYVRNLRSMGYDEYADHIQKLINQRNFDIFIEEEQQEMVYRRNSFARDIKLLALQAELLEQGENMQTDEKGQIHLPSGIQVQINIDDEAKKAELLNPKCWIKRTRLKDRVYKIQIGKSVYILKERKTATHKDIKEHGHIPTNTSQKEAEISQYFKNNARSEQDNIRVNWENCIGFVTFPDGFQFSVFEVEDDLIPDFHEALEKLTQEILQHAAKFQAEFEKAKKNISKYWNHQRPDDKPPSRLKQFGLSLFYSLKLQKNPAEKVTFEDFAAAKAWFIIERSLSLMKEIVIQNGYQNSDTDGYHFKVYTENDAPILEVLGFDFEYFKPRSLNEDREETIKHLREREREYYYFSGVQCLSKRSQTALYYSILNLEGYLSEKDSKWFMH